MEIINWKINDNNIPFLDIIKNNTKPLFHLINDNFYPRPKNLKFNIINESIFTLFIYNYFAIEHNFEIIKPYKGLLEILDFHYTESDKLQKQRKK